jgi:ribosomal protein S19
MRSPWKKFYIDYILKNIALKFQKLSTEEKQQTILFVDSRASTILRSMVGRKVGVHNGKDYIGFTIRDYMVGHKYGEYIQTRKVGIDMHFRKKGKKGIVQQQFTKKKK